MRSRTLNYLLWAIVFFALIGFADSVFLLTKRLSGAPIPCFITSGCDAVSKSPHSVLFGVPLSLWGVIFYLSIGFITLLFIDTGKMIIARFIPLATTLGFLSSLYFLYVQKFLIGAFCIYCILSAVVATVLFVLSMTVCNKLRKL